MNPKTIPIGVTKTIAEDYARRDIFPELRPGQQWFVRKFPDKELYHTLDYKLAFRVLEDAAEQEWVRRGRSGVGVTLAYRSLGRRTLFFLRQVLDFDPAKLFYFLTGPEPDFGESSCCQVQEVFHCLGIPIAGTAQRLQK